MVGSDRGSLARTWRYPLRVESHRYVADDHSGRARGTDTWPYNSPYTETRRRTKAS